MLERSSCGASFGNIKISDLDFADDAVSFAETLDILLGASRCCLRSQSRWDYGFPGSKLRSRLSMTLDAAVLSVPVCGEDVEVVERFTYLGSDIHVSAVPFGPDPL